MDRWAEAQLYHSPHWCIFRTRPRSLCILETSPFSQLRRRRLPPWIDEADYTGEDMEEPEVLELYELHYSDLMLLYSESTVSPDLRNNHVSTPSPDDERRRLEMVRRKVMETLGPHGPGLLSITGVPWSCLLRSRLLPLAQKLALLDNERRKLILKEHGLGTDVPMKNPDRKVSSFAMQLKYVEALEGGQAVNMPLDLSMADSKDDRYIVSAAGDNEFCDLGYCMMKLGLCLARVCDKAMGGEELERSLLESGTAKGRLVHYHSNFDNVVQKWSFRNMGSSNKIADVKGGEEHPVKDERRQFEHSDFIKTGSHDKLWQQWHYDYGIFTVLTAPMFLGTSCPSENVMMAEVPVKECYYPGRNTNLQIFNPNKNNVCMVRTSPENFIIQVGESADILSKGKLRSTLHCVNRPQKMEFLSRETFVVFLQPAWSKTFSLTGHKTVVQSCSDDQWSNDGNGLSGHGSDTCKEDVYKLVPPLSSRLKEGMTFAEFARETTKQYYGGSGLQANR
ncbi:hypothetical protein LINGRAHAP2_LOCUS19710 [Linum grandiflorum]